MHLFCLTIQTTSAEGGQLQLHRVQPLNPTQISGITLAIDGLTNTSDSYCSHTGTDQVIAWLQVDLGAYYSIHSVKLFYRNKGKLRV